MWDLKDCLSYGHFENTQHMVKVMGKKILTICILTNHGNVVIFFKHFMEECSGSVTRAFKTEDRGLMV